MIEAKSLIEEIFNVATTLDQSGGLRNTIYVVDSEIFILNYDHTVLLRFKLRRSEVQFDHPVSFRANDYDGNRFEEKDGRVIFYSEKGEYERRRICGTSDLTPAEVQELYRRYMTDSGERQVVELSRNVSDLLDPDLSHIEFSGEAGKPLLIVQRNIYSGGITEVQQKSEKNAGQSQLLPPETLTKDFGPIGVKTNDFVALFSFQDRLKFSFPSSHDTEDNYIIVFEGTADGRRNFTGIVACCLYDEIILLKEAKQNGRKK